MGDGPIVGDEPPEGVGLPVIELPPPVPNPPPVPVSEPVPVPVPKDADPISIFAAGTPEETQ